MLVPVEDKPSFSLVIDGPYCKHSTNYVVRVWDYFGGHENCHKIDVVSKLAKHKSMISCREPNRQAAHNQKTRRISPDSKLL